ncbi:hypothetical protein BDW66DRAFT_168775 [Aspergillus desertorum]
MVEEQFPWPYNCAQLYMGQNAPRVEENSNFQWRSPFCNSSSNSDLENSANNYKNTRSPQCPSYKQQEESHIWIEDVPYPSYRRAPSPSREYLTSYAENSGLSTTSLPQHSPKRLTGRQPPNSMSQSKSGPLDVYAANDAYSRHDIKRQRAEAPPVVLHAPSHAPQDTRSGSNYDRPQTSSTPTTQPATQAAIHRTFQKALRPGSQYVAPGQTRPMTQVQPQRAASPAISQQHFSQYEQQPHGKAAPRAPSSPSPQTTAQQLPRHNEQYAAPQTTPQSRATTVTPSATQCPAQEHPRPVSRSDSHYYSSKQTPHALPQTVAPSDTQIGPLYMPRPRIIPQSQPITLPQNSWQSAHQPAAQWNTNQAAEPVAKPTAQAVSRSTTQPTQQPSSHPVPLPAAKTATSYVQQHVPQNLPHRTSLSAQPALPVSKPSPRMAQALHPQPFGAQGKLAAYTSRPENPADRTYLKRRTDIVSRLNEADAAQKTAYDPQTIARDILIASGRHPTEAQLNHHLVHLRDIFTAVEMNSDLARFRWDLVDPGQPSREIKAEAANHSVPTRTSETAPHPAVQVAVPVNNTFSPPQYPSQSQYSSPVPQLQQVQLPPPPPQQPNSQFISQNQPQFQPQVQLKRQQPVSSPVHQPRSETPNTPESMEKKRRGRPPGSTNKPKVGAASVAPPQRTSSYPVFACRWGNCQSELHNLELLKKHLFKSHVSYQITCGWKGCTFTGTLPAAELMKHAKKEHIDSLAWKLGDGPAVPTSVDRDISAVPLTIPESNQPGNEDALIFPAEYNSIRAFNKVHGNNSQLEKAREIFRAVQRLKERIGVGLDPGGCELATPLRNQRLSNDEDVYEVRPAS